MGDRSGRTTADSRRQRASGAQVAALSEKEQKELAKRLPSWEEVRRLLVAPSTSAPASGPVSSTPSSIQSKPAPSRLAIAEPTEEPIEEPGDSSFPPANDDQLPSERLPLGKPAFRVFGRFLVTFCAGVAATLAWQSYGGTVREMIVSSFPQLSWLAPPVAPVAEASGLAPPLVAEAPAAPSPDQEELKRIWFGLAGVRQRVDEVAAQLAAGQEQVTRDINKLQEVEQDILAKISAPPPRPAAAPGRKSVPLGPLPLTPLPPTPPEVEPAH
jgi:hypothetical protein